MNRELELEAALSASVAREEKLKKQLAVEYKRGVKDGLKQACSIIRETKP